ncbi:MAG TPA: hypothetical protein VFV58_24035 [Blastocatellia bacterium]|jgi:hypothetical protein|nr:hypothetical protein [Blastocatellia bacterium]
MARTATIEKPKAAQPQAQAEQSAPAAPKTADELLAGVMAIEAELGAIPERRRRATEIAVDETETKKIESALAIVEELNTKERTLHIQRWRAQKAYLAAAHKEASEINLQAEVSMAREELHAAQQAVKDATAVRDTAEHKLKTIAGQWRGAAMRAQELAGEIQRHERERPQP